MLLKHIIRSVFIINLCLVAGITQANITQPSLSSAETAAIQRSSEIAAIKANADALSQSAVAANQLSDPKLVLGTSNVPVDTFDFQQEAMTQIQVGVQQNFPRGRSLHYQAEEKKQLSAAQQHVSKVTQLQIRQAVRVQWINLYYWLEAKRIILKEQSIFKHLISVTESMLSNNKAQQKDVIRAQLELSNLQNRLLTVNQQIQTARAQLARWTGQELAQQANPNRLPQWSQVPGEHVLLSAISQHPSLQVDKSLIQASTANVNYARQQYFPGYTVGMIYGFRQGHDLDGGRRSDFLSVQVSVDLPVFTVNRQDKTLGASESKLVISQENQITDYRGLQETTKTQYALWQQAQKSTELYKKDLVPQSIQYAEATMSAYQNTQTDFPTLADAYIRELDTKLAGLKANIDRSNARVNLLYLEGK